MTAAKAFFDGRHTSAVGSLVAGLVLAAGAWGLSSLVDKPQVTKEVCFEKYVLTRDFISEGAAVGDVDRDGRVDVIAGPYWFEAPGWTPHEISEPQTFSPEIEYSHSFLNFTLDVDLDGWTDVIRIGFPGTPAYWFENPQGEDRHWEAHRIHPAVGNESPRFVDVDGDGRKDLLFADTEARQMVWLRAPTTPGDSTWQRFPISKEGAPGTDRFSHGLGFGDLNGDGRGDVFIREGWWEAPPDPRDPGWTFHAADLGPAHAQMYAYDFDGDGDADVAASSAHGYGLWWYEQERRSWTQHLIYEGFSQSHNLAFADIDADGDPDLITGKRYLAHNGKDPGSGEPAVLYWFEFERRGDGAPSWTPHRIDANSGGGLQVVAEDITGDALVDLVVANKKGVFLFEQVR